MRKKANKSSPRGSNQKPKSKAAFVRGLPPNMPASEVIERAQAQGIKLTPAYVYVIRSKSGGKPPPSKQRARAGAARQGSSERAFVDLALQLGFGRAQALLDSARQRIQRSVLR